MDQPLVTFYRCMIPALFFMIFSPKFMYAYDFNFTSIANLSSSWINKPTSSILVNSNLLSNFRTPYLTPILFSKTNYTNFVCGFYCPYDGTAKCLFGVLLYLPDYLKIYINEPQLIWSANRDRPIKINATLNFTSEGEIILKDADDSLVWSTNTKGKNISRLKLTEIGNLVLYNKAEEIVWQSFDHPTDSLLPGQYLVTGQKLTSSMSAWNWSGGQYWVDVQNTLLVFYMNSNPPQKYYQTDKIEDLNVTFNGTSLGISLSPLDSVGQFIRLEPDGSVKIYGWTSSTSLSGRDVLTSRISFSSIANLSSSWINKPTSSIRVNSNLRFNFDPILTPILFSKTNYTNFVCGFYCPDEGTAKCLFGVLLYLPVPESPEINVVNEPQLIWSANRDRPIKINATLNFTSEGEIILKDADDSLVWSTSTRGKNISRLKLTEIGNLVLYNKAEEIVWQSFDHPTDSLLPGQYLVTGQKLTSSMSALNWSGGRYWVDVQNTLLVSYMNSNPPQKYYQTDKIEDLNVTFNGTSLGISLSPLDSVGQFIRLEPDGSVKIYVWTSSTSLLGRDVLTSRIGECGYPLVCERYGMCSNGQCSCPEEAENETSSFRQISYRQPTRGCTPITPISCNQSHLHILLELKNTTYFNLNRDISYMMKIPEVDEELNLEDCKKKCLSNCSCKAAVFAYRLGGFGQRGCLLVSEIFSLINNEGGFDKVSVFLKVQNIANSLTKTSSKRESTRTKIIIGSSLGGSLATLFLFCLCLFVVMRKKESEEIDEFDVDQVSGMPSRFSFEKLRTITSDFSSKLGQGGFGSVFEGALDDGTKVAVKRLDGLGHIKKSFLAEVETVGSIHHVNLVSLIGFCAEKSHRLLVYEYMPNGSLDKWIFRNNEEPTLDWQTRRKIISDIAKGLAYLHEDCKMKIFHLDIKPQNILIDEDFSARVSDFGLAKLIGKDQSRVMMTLRGTPGYLAPEWLSSIITEKVDVYSFGVVVLEILCGRRNIDHSQPEDEMHLLALFKTKAEQSRLEDIVAEDLKLHSAEVIEMMKVAVWCLQSDFSKRPSMSVVVKVLEGSANVVDNLDYNFTNLIISKTCIATPDHLQNVIRDATPLLPVTLSGPR